MSEAPKRAYEITLRIGADDWEAARRAIRHAAEHLISHGPECNSTMGGPSSNHMIDVEHRPGMTHEKYFEQIDAYLAERKAVEV